MDEVILREKFTYHTLFVQCWNQFGRWHSRYTLLPQHENVYNRFQFPYKVIPDRIHQFDFAIGMRRSKKSIWNKAKVKWYAWYETISFKFYYPISYHLNKKTVLNIFIRFLLEIGKQYELGKCWFPKNQPIFFTSFH